MFAFAGNLMSMSGSKGDKTTMPKIKKTSSHMSDYLNKNKTQKPASVAGTAIKLPGIFGRVAKK